jgi:hypothetical protein
VACLGLVFGGCEDPVSTPQDITAASSVVQGHFHRATISGRDIADPPSGGSRITTTNDQGHTHVVALSSTQLADLQQQGAVVSVLCESAGTPAHTHVFTFEP